MDIVGLQNSGSDTLSVNDLSKIYWIDQESVKAKSMNGVCRIVAGRHDSGRNFDMTPELGMASRNLVVTLMFKASE